MIRWISTLVLIGTLAACSGEGSGAQQSAEPVKTETVESVDLAAEAAKIFKNMDGIWDSKWDRLDKDGNVVGSFEGVETFSYLIDDKVQRLYTEIPSQNQRSEALLAYNNVAKKIVFYSVDQNGDYWLMKQDPITGTVQSEPHLSANGKSQIIRFTTVRQTADDLDVKMEMSVDNGATWRHLTNQYMKRRAPK